MMPQRVLPLLCSLLLLCFSACSKSNDSDPDPEPTPVPAAPTLTVGDATDIRRTTATVSGSAVIPEGTTVKNIGFLYSTVSTLSEQESTFVSVTLQGTNAYTASLQGLTPGTTYYYCFYLRTNDDELHSAVKEFTTEPVAAPVVGEVEATDIAKTSVALSCPMTDDGGAQLTSCGFCYRLKDDADELVNVENATSVEATVTEGVLTAVVDGLEPGTTYRFRAYAENEEGITYSSVLEVTTVSDDVPEIDEIVSPDKE